MKDVRAQSVLEAALKGVQKRLQLVEHAENLLAELAGPHSTHGQHLVVERVHQKEYRREEDDGEEEERDEAADSVLPVEVLLTGEQ